MRFILFLVINFGALFLGSALMGSIPDNQWYAQLNKAPWTPPGWVFGAAWFSIMLCLTIYMFIISGKYTYAEMRPFYLLYVLQIVLNIAWNPTFFRWQYTIAGLIIIVALTILVWYMFYRAYHYTGWSAALLIPYGIWLLIATSLNAYVIVKN